MLIMNLKSYIVYSHFNFEWIYDILEDSATIVDVLVVPDFMLDPRSYITVLLFAEIPNSPSSINTTLA